MKKKNIWIIVMILISSAYAELEPGKLWINSVEIPYSVEEKDISISIATIKDEYSVGEIIELTDPPEGLDFSSSKIISNEIKERFNDNIPINYQEINDHAGLGEKDLEKPKYYGYIIQFKEKPVLEKKKDIEKEAEQNKYEASYGFKVEGDN